MVDEFSMRERGYEMRAYRGCVQVLAYDDPQQLVDELRQDAKDDAVVEAQRIPWAGPLEVLISVSTATGAITGGLGALAGGVAALITAFTRRHPDKPIKFTFEDNSVVIVQGQELDPETSEKINTLFTKNSTPASQAREGYGMQDLPL